MSKKKSDNIEYEKRIRVVQEWILEDWPTSDIVANIAAKWGIEDRQAKRYVAEARKRWVKEEDQIISHKRKLKVESLKKLKRSLLEKYKGTPEGIKAIIVVEKELIQLEGLAMPLKVQNQMLGADGKPIDPVKMNITLTLPPGLNINLPSNTDSDDKSE